MKHRSSILITCLALIFLASPGFGQSWSGVLDPSRAIDWSNAGIPGGIPSANWTQCGSTIASGASAATINAALAACPANHYVLLGPGTFPGGITWNKSNVALRGSGADQTVIQGSGSTTCYGLGTTVGICSTDGTYANGPPSPVYNWTAGYSKGGTSITLSSTSGIAANQTIVLLDQCDDGYQGANCSGSSVDTGNYFVCSDQYSNAPTGCGSEGGSNAYRPHRAQIQAVVPINVSGNVLTIPSPGLYAPQWRASQTPQAWLIRPIVQAGIENLTIDATNSGSNGVLVWNGLQCWVSGVKFVKTGKTAVWLFQTVHSVVQNNYIYQSQDGDPYGIQEEIGADNLVVNNIIQQNRSPIVLDGASSGDVFAYNFTILNQSGDAGNWSFWNHGSGIAYELWEGNVAGGFANDDIHGSHNMITRFRNYFTGHEDHNSGQINPIFDAAYSRYGNVVGNVLGTSGFDNTYSEVSFNNSTSIFTIGAGNPGSSPPVPDDSKVATTLMRWGNWDTVTNAVRWCGNSSDPGWTSTCSSTSEVPSGISPYANPVPSNQNLPASFYTTSKPSWWPSAKAWPPIGPDVSGGNISGTAGHVYSIPAQDCYTTMGGPADGSGGVLSFNADTCYTQGGGGDPPAPPSNLVASPQ